MSGYKWTINKGNLLFEGDRAATRGEYENDYMSRRYSFNNQPEIILFNQEKIVVQCWEDIYQH